MSSVSPLGLSATTPAGKNAAGYDQRSHLAAATSSKGTRPYSFTGMNVSDLLFIEVFAGTARLCKATKEFGIEVLPVDKTSSRASQIYIAQYDVTDPEQLECFMEVLEV